MVYSPPPMPYIAWFSKIGNFLSEMFTAFFDVLPWWIGWSIAVLLFCFVTVLLFKWVI